MELRKSIAFIFVATLGLSGESFAEDEANISLVEVQQYALIHSPEVKKIDENFSSAVAKALSIEAPLNPELVASAGIPVSYDGERPEVEFAASLHQPVRLSDFGIRDRVADRIRSLGTKEQQAQLHEFLGKLTLSYYSLWALQEEEVHLKEQLEHASEIVQLLAKPGSIGRFSPPQQQTARATVARVEAELMGLEHKTAVARAALTRLSGLSFAKRRAESPEIPRLPDFTSLWSDVEASEASLLRRFEVRNALALEENILETRDSFPGLTPHLGVSRNEEDSEFLGVGLTIPLPLFQSNEAGVERSEARKTSTAAKLGYLRSEAFKEEFRLLVDGARAKHRQVTAYEERVLPALEAALRGSERLFKNGQLSLFELWQSQTDFHDAIDRSIELRIEALVARVEISAITGTILY